MRSLLEVLTRRRPEPALDVGLPAERTAMAWQRTGLALAGFSALLVHFADRDLLVATPGLVGLVGALALLLVGERRYSRAVRRIEAGEPCGAHRLVVALTGGVVALSLASLVAVVSTGT